MTSPVDLKTTLIVALAVGFLASLAGEAADRANAIKIVDEHMVSANIQLADRAVKITTKAVLTFGVLGASLGLALGLLGGLGRTDGSATNSALGAIVGLIGGLASGAGSARLLVPWFLRNEDTTVADDLIMPLLTHSGIWIAVGASSGLALGVGLGGSARGVVSAILGGVCGALLGAVFNEFIGGMLFPSQHTGQPISEGLGSRVFGRFAQCVFTAVGAVVALRAERVPDSASKPSHAATAAAEVEG